MDDTSPETFVCLACGRTRPACDGSEDDMPGYCDRCWALANGEPNPADHSCPACEPERWSRGDITEAAFGE